MTIAPTEAVWDRGTVEGVRPAKGPRNVKAFARTLFIRRAKDRSLTWFPPDDYTPIRGVAAYVLKMDTPEPGSAEDKLVEMIVRCRTPREVDLTPQMARGLIDRRIVTTGLYPSVLAIALEL